ncbi:MAG: prepilin-type N-terminal cleavage/methylation domain-containing protein [Sedimentisphaerales bacterium]
MTENGQYDSSAFTPLETDGHNRWLSGNPLAKWNILFLTGFTLIEVIIVLMIIGIISAIAVPLYVSAASVQLKTAANIIACDLEYAKNLAMSTGRNYSVVFDVSTESYRINDANGQVISHPVHIGANYIVNFANDNRLNKVNIVSATFGTTSTVKFDYLGAPFDGSGNPLNSGSVRLNAEGNILTVRVEPVTGYVSIDANS